MSSDLFSAVKMRGSLAGLVICLAGSIGAYALLARTDTPEVKAVRDCARRELEHYTGERFQGHIPFAAYQAAWAKCAQELQSKAST
jgi:hypothetical protein